MLNRFTVRTRLVCGFGVILALFLLSGVLTLWHLRASNDNLKLVVDDGNRKVYLAQHLAELLHVGVESTLITMISNDHDAVNAAVKRGDGAYTVFRKERDELKALFQNDPQGQKLIDVMLDVTLHRSGPDFERFVQFIQQGKRDEASAWLIAKAGPSMQELQVALKNIVDYQTEKNRELRDATEHAYDAAKTMTVAAQLLALASSVAVVAVLLRGLYRELGAEPRDLARQAKRIAEGELGHPAALRDGDSASVMASVAQMQAKLAGIVADVRANAERVASASVQIAAGNQDLSSRTEEQASALEETAATMEQLSSTVRNNAEYAGQADQLARAAAGVATRGGEVVDQVVGTMQGISESSGKIGDIIAVIDGIAFQTNILALNAAVEAARAGEQGRGFAVVASEVRTLARRSAEAAKEIKTLITRNVEQVEQGATLVDRAGKTMGEIVGSIRHVSEIVAEISAATAEQSHGIHQVGDAIGQMDRVTQQNAALVEESAAAAESLKEEARKMVETVAFFRTAAVAPAGRPAPRKELPSPRLAAPQRVGKAGPAFAGPAHAAARVMKDEWETF